MSADRFETLCPSVEAVRRHEPALLDMDHEGLKVRAESLRRRARMGEPLDDLLVETFALVREAARRALGQRLYDVQVAAGIALHRGHVAEMGTGEGKTLAAVAPVFLNALAGNGVHVLTFNDYLARRDAAWMGPVYEMLGSDVGFVQEEMSVADRQSAYARDVTYVTAKEAGFDLLRDGLCLEREEQVHRPFHFALVDEADSILIDEARIPLVIAGAVEESTAGLVKLAALVRVFEKGSDFETDEYAHNIFLTDRGATRVEEVLGGGSLFTGRNAHMLAAARNALHAEFLLRRDVDYIVRGGEVEIVDELTGRVAENRHWPDGLQAAVEAKEGLRLGSDGRLLGSITLQHFLALYPKLCGMTATAHSSAEELSEVYGLEVATIPPHEPCIREDIPDRIYTHREARDRAVLDEVAREHEKGRPVLVGTVSVAASESLAVRLSERGVRCTVLNARNDEEEAAIVAEAGALGAVTISTNMAGRGTDIRLGGRDEGDRDRVIRLGGLLVIGTNRHESVRIDNQLRGRAGRQGDPGQSRFHVSLEDDMLRRYGIERLIPARFRPKQSEGPIESKVIRKEIQRAQRIVEGESFDVRKRLESFARIIETRRGYLAERRQAVLEDHDPLDLLATRAADRRAALREKLGETSLRDVERRLTLLTIDRCWSDYLTEMQAVRDEVHLVVLDGRTPLAEFIRTAGRGFDLLEEAIDDAIVETFMKLEVGPDGVDWDKTGLRGPSATWTYLVNDDVFSKNIMRVLGNRASIGLWGALALGPVLFFWGLYEHWRRRRRRTHENPLD